MQVMQDRDTSPPAEADYTEDFEVWSLQEALGLHAGHSPETVAKALGINVSTVYRWLQSGQLRGRQIGKLWRTTRDDLEEFVRQQDERREQTRRAEGELRRMKRLRPTQSWRIATCEICGAPIVTDGSDDSFGQEVSQYSRPAGEVFFACPVTCLDALSGRLSTLEDLEAEDIPFE